MVLLGKGFTSGTTTDSSSHMMQERCSLSDRYVLRCFTGSEELSGETENPCPHSDTMLITGRSFVLHHPSCSQKSCLSMGQP